MIWMAVGATAAFVLLGLGHGFWPWLIAWFVGSTLASAFSPLTDVITLRRSRLEGFAYEAWPRGWSVRPAMPSFGNVGDGGSAAACAAGRRADLDHGVRLGLMTVVRRPLPAAARSGA